MLGGLQFLLHRELGDAIARLDAAADALASTPLGQMSVADLQAWAVDFEAPDSSTAACPDSPLKGKTIAIARDAAFCFIYAANIDCLIAMGAKIVYFSPLADSNIPPCDALWVPGGYPELHGEKLSANAAMRSSIAGHVAASKPVWAECGGMMALFDELTALDGARWPMWGVLQGTVTLQKRLAALGPQQLAVDAGVLRGHTFHYSTCATTIPAITRTQAAPRSKLRGDGEALYVSGSVKASYFHAWFASNPLAAAHLFLKDGDA